VRAVDRRRRGRLVRRRAQLFALLAIAAGCEVTHEVPAQPTWADAAPILRGACGGCHGPTAAERVCPGFGDPEAQRSCSHYTGDERYGTGGGLRFDLYDVTPEVCGDAALALVPGVQLAGSPAATSKIGTDIVPQGGARFPTMPPQPSPALPDWQIQTLVRWSAAPTKGPPPTSNRPPTIEVSGFPPDADGQLAFTAVLADPDQDGVIGVIEVGGLAFLMDRPGSFAVALDTRDWPAGPVRPVAVLCDGWSSISYDLGPIQIRH